MSMISRFLLCFLIEFCVRCIFVEGVDVFRCADDKQSILISEVNDDYCDCGDGSDEWETSACSNQKFVCKTIPTLALKISSSKVGDGICDCCDGSDELRNVCVDNCDAQAKAQREIEMKQQAQFAEGSKIWKTYIDSTRDFMIQTNDELSSLQVTLNELASETSPHQLELSRLRLAESEAMKQHETSSQTTNLNYLSIALNFRNITTNAHRDVGSFRTVSQLLVSFVYLMDLTQDDVDRSVSAFVAMTPTASTIPSEREIFTWLKSTGGIMATDSLADKDVSFRVYEECMLNKDGSFEDMDLEPATNRHFRWLAHALQPLCFTVIGPSRSLSELKESTLNFEHFVLYLAYSRSWIRELDLLLQCYQLVNDMPASVGMYKTMTSEISKYIADADKSPDYEEEEVNNDGSTLPRYRRKTLDETTADSHIPPRKTIPIDMKLLPCPIVFMEDKRNICDKVNNNDRMAVVYDAINKMDYDPADDEQIKFVKSDIESEMKIELDVKDRMAVLTSRVDQFKQLMKYYHLTDSNWRDYLTFVLNSDSNVDNWLAMSRMLYDCHSNPDVNDCIPVIIESQIGKYLYQISGLEQVAQFDGKKANGRGTVLGSLHNIQYDSVKGRLVLAFDGGDKCWNGPQRSVMLILECSADLDNVNNIMRIKAAEEPSTCVYEMYGVSPIACGKPF